MPAIEITHNEGAKILKYKGFTLIEILIAVMVIGVLAGIILLMAAGSREKANAAACMGEREKIKTAFSTQLVSTNNFAAAVNEILGGTPAKLSGDIDAVGKHAEFTGLCKDGGVFDIDYAGGMFFVHCSKHGGDDAAAYRAAHPETADAGQTESGPGHSGHTGGTSSGSGNESTGGTGGKQAIFDTGINASEWTATADGTKISKGKTFYNIANDGTVSYYIAKTDFTINKGSTLLDNSSNMLQLLPTIENGNIDADGKSSYYGYFDSNYRYYYYYYKTIYNGQIVKFNKDYYVFNYQSGSKSYYLKNKKDNKLGYFKYNSNEWNELDPSSDSKWIALE